VHFSDFHALYALHLEVTIFSTFEARILISCFFSLSWFLLVRTTASGALRSFENQRETKWIFPVFVLEVNVLGTVAGRMACNSD